MGKGKGSGPGRPKAFDSPKQLWDCFEKYRKKVKSNPIIKHDFVGKNAEEVERKLERCLTKDGFDNFLYEKGLIYGLKDYRVNKDGNYNAFSPICTRIDRIIRDDQIQGGMAGIYNPSITQRLNGLTDKSKVEHSGGFKVEQIKGMEIK